MPLRYQRSLSPYRFNYFTLLGVGPSAKPGVISAMRRKIAAKIQHGTPHQVAGREVTEAELAEAESRLLDERDRAHEVLLVHAAPSGGNRRLQRLCRAVVERVTPRSVRHLALIDLTALIDLLPHPDQSDVELPAWDEFGIPAAGSDEDFRLDVQFDL